METKRWQTDGHMDTDGEENIIPQHYHVAGYKMLDVWQTMQTQIRCHIMWSRSTMFTQACLSKYFG